MATATEEPASSEQLINRNLKSLVAVIFLFYGGLGSLYGTLVPHIIELGFYESQIRIILTTVALISLIGPLIVGPLTDRIADRRRSAYGSYLRIIIAVLLVLGAIAYGLLLLVPPVHRSSVREPSVSFGCDANGAIIFQERCSDEKTCFHWEKKKFGQLILTNCSYTCQNPSQIENLYNPWIKSSVQPPIVAESTSREKAEEYDYLEVGAEDTATAAAAAADRVRREIEQVFVEPPHLCLKKVDENGNEHIERCHVYTSDSDSLKVDAALRGATNQENETHSAEWCNYPLDGFSCNIPIQQGNYMKKYMNNTKCKPMIECEVLKPYSTPSVLAESKCFKIDGDPFVTYWSYLGIRIIADLFPVSIITLLNTAIIIATRETSTGRADVGRQLAWGALGWFLFVLILAVFGVHGSLKLPVGLCIVAWITAAIILLTQKKMPFSPPEWWWHTKSGMMAIPLSAIRKYGLEIVALTVVAVILGAFWSVIDTYQPLHLLDLNVNDAPVAIKLSIALAALPAIFLLWKAEVIVDYCGHANILIAAFAVHILRFTSLSFMDSPWYALFTHSLESITLVLMFVTLVLYMRHLIPRRLIATGQALPVIAIFCLGNGLGTLIVPLYIEKHLLFRDLAIVASIVGTIYFILYHGYLARRCSAAQQPPPSPAELQTHSNVGNGTQNGQTPVANGNNYTPLRIYHNGRGRKGHFRY